jgi:uncharacterized membrane protein YhaH (DUF805 family)
VDSGSSAVVSLIVSRGVGKGTRRFADVDSCEQRGTLLAILNSRKECVMEATLVILILAIFAAAVAVAVAALRDRERTKTK